MNIDPKQMERDKLWQLYCKKDKQFQAAKLKRTIITIIGYAVAIFLILHHFEKHSGLDILGEFLVALFLSGVLFVVNTIVFVHLVRTGDAEEKNLRSIQREIDNLNK